MSPTKGPKKNKKKVDPKTKVIAVNKRARHDYHVLESVEVGIVLSGSEIKSIRAGQCSLAEAYARIENAEVWLVGMHVAEYFEASHNNHMSKRRRKLLLHRSEIRRLAKKLKSSGLTLIPLDVHLNEREYAKLELGLCQGKKSHDKREAVKKRDSEREIRSYKR